MQHMPDDQSPESTSGNSSGNANGHANGNANGDPQPGAKGPRGERTERPDPIEPIAAQDQDTSTGGGAEPTPGAQRRLRSTRPDRSGALSAETQSLLDSLREPWLLAAWPGMGGVAAIAAGHLAQTLGAQPVGMLSLAEHFPLDGVDVQHGIARANPTPRCLLLAWKDPQRKRDLLLLLGEAQPPSGGAEICRKIMDMAQARGVARVVTFAAMGNQVDPREDPRVLGATTAPTILEEFTAADIERLPQGKVTGLNGALLAVAADRGVPAVCLLGEMPIFAAGMPNPRASLEILNAFNRFADMDINVDLLIERAAEMQPQLEAMHEQITRLGGDEPMDVVDDEHDSDEDAGSESGPSAGSGSGSGTSSGRNDDARRDAPLPPRRPARDATPRVDDHAREHIERLFRMAEGDREQAQRLKDELDRLGLFAEYEDRFLDLFRSPS